MNDYAIFTPKYRPDNSRVILRLGTTRVQSNPARWLVVTGPRHASSGRDRQRRRRRLIFNPCAVWQGPKGNRTVRGCKPLPLKFKRFFPVRGFYRATGRCFDPAIAATPRSEKGYIKRIAKRYFRSCGNAVKTLPQYQYPKGDAALRLREFPTSPGLDGLFQFWDRVVSAIIFAGGVDAHDWAIGAGNSAVVNLFPPALWAWPCIFIVQIIVRYVP